MSKPLKFLFVVIAVCSLFATSFVLFIMVIPAFLNTLATERKAMQDDPEEQRVLAYGYKSGSLKSYSLGRIERDPSKAIYWYTESANNGNIEAAYELADLYETQRADNEAIRWYVLAGNRGDLDACKRLVQVYTNGELGESKCVSKAKRWTQCAALPVP